MKKIVLVVVACVAAMIVSAQTVRLATYRYGNDSRVKSLQPFADHLRTKYGYDVSVKSYPSVHAFIKGIQNNEVDIAFINTFGYLMLEASGKDYPMRAVSTLKMRDDIKETYRTAIIAGPHVQAKRLADLKNIAAKLRITFVNTGSTSGNLVPRLGLAQVGLPSPEKAFKSVLYSDIHDAAVQAVINKMSDVAAVGLTEYEKYMQEDITNRSKMRLIWLSPDIPYGPIMFNKRFGSAVGGELLSAFVNLHKENPRAFAAMKAGWSETREATHFISINGSYYDGFKKIVANEGEMQRVLKQFIK